APLVFTLSMGGSGCARRAGPRPPSTQAGITDQQRVRAMLSIHAHARWPDAKFKTLPFLPLGDAVQILKSDRGPAADSRRRRAVAKLAAYGLGRDDFRRDISDLG